MIRTIYRRIGGYIESIVERNVASLEEDVNKHLSLGWKLVSAGWTRMFVWAILEKEV